MADSTCLPDSTLSLAGTAVNATYELSGDLSQLAAEIGQRLNEKYLSAIWSDQTVFVGRDSCYRTDTYQLHSALYRGTVTINLSFFRPEIARENFVLKVSFLPPVLLLGPTHNYFKTLKEEVEAVIFAHGGKEIKQPE